MNEQKKNEHRQKNTSVRWKIRKKTDRSWLKNNGIAAKPLANNNNNNNNSELKNKRTYNKRRTQR